MANLPIKRSLVHLLMRRSYSAVTEKGTTKQVMMRKKGVEGQIGSGEEEKAFWMRDPKTGNWMPESHFGEIDVAELRERLLSWNSKNNPSHPCP